jgi:hypothetical protein
VCFDFAEVCADASDSVSPQRHNTRIGAPLIALTTGEGTDGHKAIIQILENIRRRTGDERKL